MTNPEPGTPNSEPRTSNLEPTRTRNPEHRNPGTQPVRIRFHGPDRGRRRQVLGRADRAVAASLQHRRRAFSAAADPRVRRHQEGRGAGEWRTGRPARRTGLAHRPRGRRSDRRQARRALPAVRLADRQRHADEHERQRGHLEPRDRDGRRRDGQQEADPSERPRQSRPVVERHVSDGDAHRRGRRSGAASAAAKSPRCARRSTPSPVRSPTS